MTPPPPRQQSLSELAKQCFDEVVNVLAHDMPLLMHGSGDVQPSDVHPESVRILSELTADYIANLVRAAMDAHEILNDGPQRLPPPPLPRDRAPPIPSPPKLTNDHTAKASSTAATSTSSSIGGSSGKQQGSKDHQQQTTKKRQQKRPRTEDEFWDEPLPEPKIKGMSISTNQYHRKGAAAAFVPKYEGVPIDEWVGVTGVDFWETSRARKAHVSAPSAITTPSFIFPICHDVGLYGKVLDVQSARRAIAPLMVDKILMDMVQAEGASLGPSARRRNRNKRGGGDSNNGGGGGDDDHDDPEETDLERKGGATWPGLEYLLPVHVMDDIFGGDCGSSE